jgi:hypothetical protein
MKYATLFAAVIALGCTSAPPQPAGPKYTASGYAISGSAGWEERPGYHGSDLTYLSPAEGAQDAFREHIRVVIELLPPKTTIEEHVRYVMDSLGKIHKQFKVETQAPVTVGAINGQYVKYTYAGGKERMSNEAYLFERKKMLYVVTCAATEASFARYKPEFDKIVRTFRLAP